MPKREAPHKCENCGRKSNYLKKYEHLGGRWLCSFCLAEARQKRNQILERQKLGSDKELRCQICGRKLTKKRQHKQICWYCEQLNPDFKRLKLEVEKVLKNAEINK